MVYRLLLAVLLLSFSSSGCIFLLADALGHSSSKKGATRNIPKEAETPAAGPVEFKSIEGSRQDVFNTTVSILLDRGYFITSSDYDAGMVVAEKQEPDYSEIKVSVAESSGARTKARILITDRNGPFKDPRFVSKLLDDIQTEVIHRQSRRQKTRK